MRTFIIIIASLVALCIVAGVAALWLLKDPNRFKGEIETLIADNTGMQVELKGDLSWQLWPPVVLQAEDLAFEDDETKYHLQRLDLNASASALLSTTPELRIQSLQLTGLTMSDKRFESVTEVAQLSISDFAIGEPSPLHIEAVSGTTSDAPMPITLDAIITYFDEADEVIIKDARFDADGIPGICQAKVTHLSRDPTSDHKETADDLLPLDTFRAMDWDADCVITAFDAGGVILKDIAVTAKNVGGLSDINVKVPDFFDGTATVAVDINASRHNPQWKIAPKVDGADTQAVMDWMQQNLSWAAPLLFDGEFQMVGNTTDALISSIKGKANFDGGQGKIDISAIKRNAAILANLASSAGASLLPELQQAVLDYSKLAGDMSVDGNQQTMKFALDNLNINAEGLLDTLADKMDMRVELTFNDNPDLQSFDIAPALQGIPIPIRCTGSVAEPDCGIDRSATQKVIAAVLRGQAGSKLQDAIADKVPDKYKEQAKGLLKGLGLFGKKKEDG